MSTTNANIKEGTYCLENIAFDAESPKCVLTPQGLSGVPGTPMLCWPFGGNNDSQFWSVTKFEQGYNFQCVDPITNVFIGSIGPGEVVTATPLQKNPFTLNDAGGNNKYQIVTEDNGKKYALQAPSAASQPVTLRSLVATDSTQIWHFVLVG